MNRSGFYDVNCIIASVEYAVKWINGEVPREGVDIGALKQSMKDYVGVKVCLTRFVSGETGTDNFFLLSMDYFIYNDSNLRK